MKTLVIAVLLFSCSVCAGEGKEGKGFGAFYSGSEYLQLIDKRGVENIYIRGLHDGISFSRQEESEWQVECFMNKNTRQVAAIFKKWLDENPEKWHKAAVTLYVKVLYEACIDH